MPNKLLLALPMVLTSLNSASAAPQQLLNKSITASYTAMQLNRDPDGRTFGVQTGVNVTIYVSSAGRLFEYGTRSVGGQSGGAYQTKDTKTSPNGREARGLHFSGNTIVEESTYASGAYRGVISFNPTFTTCTIEATWGRDGSRTLKRVGIDGVTREILSITASGNTCSIRDGNAFAK